MEIKLTFEGVVIPKVRPRVTAYGTYMNVQQLTMDNGQLTITSP